MAYVCNWAEAVGDVPPLDSLVSSRFPTMKQLAVVQRNGYHLRALAFPVAPAAFLNPSSNTSRITSERVGILPSFG